MAARGHMHQGGPNTTQNQGNSLGDRPCVKQSTTGKAQNGGSSMKDVMSHEAERPPMQNNRRTAEILADRPKNREVTGKVGSGPSSLSNTGSGSNYYQPDEEQQYYQQQQQQQQQRQPQQQRYSQGGPISQVFGHEGYDDRQPQRQPSNAPISQVFNSNQGGNPGNGAEAMKRRPGAGVANRQTFSLFGGAE